MAGRYQSDYSVGDDNIQIWGMDIIVCTSAPTDDEARELLRQLNFPFPIEEPQS